MDPFPNVKAYFARCQARPAWQRTLALYAERFGVKVDDIRLFCRDGHHVGFLRFSGKLTRSPPPPSADA